MQYNWLIVAWNNALRQRQTGRLDRKAHNDRYTRNRPEHHAEFDQESFLTPDLKPPPPER